MSRQPNARGFSADMRRLAKVLDQSIDTVVRRTAFKLWWNLQRRSPVDLGRFRSSWRVGLGAPETDVHPPVPHGARMSTAQIDAIAQRQAERLNRAGAETVIYLTNSLPYAKRLEEGWSKQAPNGMVRISLAEARAEIKVELLRREGG